MDSAVTKLLSIALTGPTLVFTGSGLSFSS